MNWELLRAFPVSFFTFFSLVMFISCGEPTLEDEARALLESKNTENEANLSQSPDGLQFLTPVTEEAQQESIGFTKDGEVSYQGNFKNGKPEGEWTTFYPDGKPRWQGNKQNGLNHGSFTMWYENGRIRMKGHFLEGVKDGLTTIWYDNGFKKQEQQHKMGIPTGIWKTWDRNGKLIRNDNYSNSDNNFTNPAND